MLVLQRFNMAVQLQIVRIAKPAQLSGSIVYTYIHIKGTASECRVTYFWPIAQIKKRTETKWYFFLPFSISKRFAIKILWVLCFRTLNCSKRFSSKKYHSEKWVKKCVLKVIAWIKGEYRIEKIINFNEY